MKIYLDTLTCYQNASPEIKTHKLYSPKRYFDLAKLPQTDVVSEIKGFIEERGRTLTALSIRSELYPFNLLCSFLQDEFPDLASLTAISESVMVQRAKIWLLKNGKQYTQSRYKTATGKQEISDAELIKYIKKIYKFLMPEDRSFHYDADRWYLENLPFKIKKNPVHAVKSISFKKISQPLIKKEIKDVIKIQLLDVALGTVCAELTAVNRFSQYLANRYPEIQSLKEIDRPLLENYLIHTNTEAAGRKSYSKELCHLKSVLIIAGKLLENKELENIFFKDDIGKVPERVYRVYSDAEIKRLNKAIIEGDEQIARALFIHQLLGTRISETLTLRQDAIRRNKKGQFLIRIQQTKTGKTYEKAVNDDIKQLFDKACQYTKEKYGKREYVFVNDKDPNMPMQYGRVQYQLMAMIRRQNIRDDSGNLFGVGTHIWRHCYGKRLTEMQVDDVMIAKLMGHANTSSLKYYRKIGAEMLAEETRKMRSNKDKVLAKIVGEWEL